MTVPGLEVEALRVGYGAGAAVHMVVDGVSFALAQGEIGCLLGASGCGKTTVLRAIAGFEPARGGRITLAGRDVAAPGLDVPVELRGVGLMFQDYALFPHLDASANVAFGLAALDRAARAARVADVLALVGLSDAAQSYPHELSGGQQQRLALARALAPSPRVLLLDEPFSNLDAGTREHLAAGLRRILKTAGTTALLVTHDQAEAFAMADAIGVMADGRILQWGTAEVLFRQPADRAVAAFVGRGAVVPAQAVGLAGEGDVLVRPDDLRPDPSGPVPAELLAVTFRGPAHVARLRLSSGHAIDVDLDAVPAAAPGDTLRLAWRTDGAPEFPRQ